MKATRPILTVIASLAVFLFPSCRLLSQGGMEPGGNFVDMEEHGHRFDVKLGDRFRTKETLYFQDVPGFERMLKDDTTGVEDGAQKFPPGMEVELVGIEMGAFGPIGFVKILKPIKDERATPLLGLFDRRRKAGETIRLNNERLERLP